MKFLVNLKEIAAEFLNLLHEIYEEVDRDRPAWNTHTLST